MARARSTGAVVVLLRSALVPAALAAAVLPLAGCPKGETLDLTPPRVLTVEPAAPVLRTTETFTIRFSEPLNDDSVSEDTVVIVPRAQVTETFISDLNRTPLSDTRKEQIVPVRLEVGDDGTRVTVAPVAPLEARTAYALLISVDVRDTIGNPLANELGQRAAFRFDFTTDDGPPIVLSHDVVSTARPLVPPNRRRFTIVFDQPMRGVTRDTLRLVGRDPAASGVDPVVEAVLLDESRTTATVLLGEGDGCFRLAPEAVYAFELGHGITDDEGQDLASEAIEFPTGPTCDTSPNVVVGAPFPVGGESTATIQFETSKASTTEVRYGLLGGALDCLGAPCPALGAPATVPAADAVPPRFVHSVEITGLAVDQTYAFRVLAEDDFGFVATAEGEVRTAPLARVALNEVMANPPASISSESEGEYVEIANWGAEPVDLSGFALHVDGGAVAGGRTCLLPEDGSAPVLEPGGFVALVGSGFAADRYGGVAEAALFRMSTSTVCGQLTNSRAQTFLLADAEGRPVSTISAYPSIVPDEDGRSIERIAPEAPDVETSFCFSRDDVGPTPGASNGVAQSGCGG